MRTMRLALCSVMVFGAMLACSPDGGRANGGRYVASRQRDKFHRPGCRWAQKINTANEVWYQTREAALAAGKKPCKVCKP